MPQFRDYDSMFDNQTWEDRPKKDPVIIKNEHEGETKLDKKLGRSSRDNRKLLMYVGWFFKMVVLAAAIAAVILLLVWGFKYSFM